MDRLAMALGLDLAALLKRHEISADTLERMAVHCSFCDEQTNCAARICKGVRAGADPPEYCQNRKLLMYLEHAPLPEAHEQQMSAKQEPSVRAPRARDS